MLMVFSRSASRHVNAIVPSPRPRAKKDKFMAAPIKPPSPLTSFQLVIGIMVMIAVPAAVTLHTARVPPTIDANVQNLTPYGYTISLLLFVVPILAISVWFLPQEQVHVSR